MREKNGLPELRVNTGRNNFDTTFTAMSNKIKGTLRLCLLLAMLHCNIGSYCADNDSVNNSAKIKVLPVPAFGSTPETGFYLGVFSLFTLDFYKDNITRISNAKAEFNYTWKKQMIFESSWNYFFKNEKWYTQGRLHYSKFSDLYFGIGESTANSSQTRYETNRIIADINFLRGLGSRLFIGPKFVYKNYSRLEYKTQGFYPELINGKNMGLGYTLLKDTRDNLLNASRGVYLEFTNVYNFLDNRYVKFILDARTYRNIAKRTVGSIRIYNEFTSGHPLYYDYALLGGDKIVRGYYYGRFRDKNLTTLQGELRSMVIGRFGAAIFGGITKMYPDVRGLSFANIKPNYGFGLRFLIDRKNNINLRLDYGIGQGDDGFYIMFGESF